MTKPRKVSNALIGLLLLLLIVYVPTDSVGADQLLPLSHMWERASRDEESLLLAAAEMIPPVDLFAVTHADAETVAALDDIVFRFSDALPDELGLPLTLSDIIAEALLPGSNLDGGALLNTIVGDTVAVGVDLLDALADGVITTDDAVIVYAVAPVRSRLLIDGALAVSGLLADAETTVQANLTLYTLAQQNRAVVLTDTHIMLVDGATFVPFMPEESLAGETDFVTATAPLDVATATALFYGANGRLVRDLATDPAVQEIFAAVGLEVGTLGPLAATFKLEEADSRTLQIDIAQARATASAAPAPPVNPDFAAHVPAESDVFVHTNEVNRLLTTVSGLIASISGSTTGRDIYAQFETLADLLLSLDLRADILPLLNGDYGVFARVPERLESADDLYFGVLLAIRDRAGAQTLINAVASAVERISDSVMVSESRIIAAASGESVNATIFTLEDPTVGLVEVAAAVTEDVLFVATMDATLALLDGGPRLLANTVYQEARAHVLPDSALTAYLADRAPGALVRLGFDLLDPVGVLFGREVTDIIIENAPGYFTELIHSSVASAVETPDGDLLLRLAVTLDAVE